MALRSTNAVIDLDLFHAMVGSGISRLRADETELRSIFPVSDHFTLTQQSHIVDWFKSDKADFTHARGYIPSPEYLPSIAYVLGKCANNNHYIGNAQPGYPDDEYNAYYAWNFARATLIQIRYDNPALAYYIFKIVLHILLSYHSVLTQTYNLLNLSFDGAATEGQPKEEGGTWIYEYVIRVSYEFNEEIVDVTEGETITSATVDSDPTVFELPQPPSTDPSLG